MLLQLITSPIKVERMFYKSKNLNRLGDNSDKIRAEMQVQWI